MQEKLKDNWKTLSLLVGILIITGYLTYSYTTSRGIFSGLSDDLKMIDPDVASPYTDINGEIIELVSFKGKPLIINSWASWIPFSQSELLLLSEVKKKKGESVEILAINRMESLSTMKAYLAFIGTPEGLVVIADQSDHFYKAVEGYAMPETLFYNRDGILVGHKRGVLSNDELQEYVELILR
ncbi:MAG: TlpA family protein disulfide reductase [Candidatus Pacebacteria bacterium]|nr:TlpA family protein disulfide reductase [Candidatus Paceibacterota bacterium]MCF7857227.1 TlpA family protein disulfide reductase [Candidatus Paceibacterota bacterium]